MTEEEKQKALETLGFERTARPSIEEIKTKYRLLAKQNHPDKHPESPEYNEIMQKINSAHDLLVENEEVESNSDGAQTTNPAYSQQYWNFRDFRDDTAGMIEDCFDNLKNWTIKEEITLQDIENFFESKGKKLNRKFFYYLDYDFYDFPNLKTLHLPNFLIFRFHYFNLPANLVDFEYCFFLGNGATEANFLDLSIFSTLVNLKKIVLGSSKPLNTGWKIGWKGSLSSLKNCKELMYLDISNIISITDGIRELPISKLITVKLTGTIFDNLLYGDGKLSISKITDYSKNIPGEEVVSTIRNKYYNNAEHINLSSSSSFEMKNAEIKKDFFELEVEYKEAVKNLEKKTKELEDALNTKSRLKEELIRAGEKNSLLETKCNELEDNLRIKTEGLNALNTKISTSENEKRSLEREKVSLENAVNQHLGTIESNNTDIRNLNERIVSLENDKISLENDKRNLVTEKENLEQTSRAKDEELQTLKAQEEKKYNNLQGENSTKTTEIEEARKKLDDLERQITNLETEKNRLVETEQNLSNQINSLSNQINELNLEKNTIQENKESLETQLADENQKNIRLESEKTSLKEEISRLNAENAGIRQYEDQEKITIIRDLTEIKTEKSKLEDLLEITRKEKTDSENLLEETKKEKEVVEQMLVKTNKKIFYLGVSSFVLFSTLIWCLVYKKNKKK